MASAADIRWTTTAIAPEILARGGEAEVAIRPAPDFVPVRLVLPVVLPAAARADLELRARRQGAPTAAGTGDVRRTHGWKAGPAAVARSARKAAGSA